MDDELKKKTLQPSRFNKKAFAIVALLFYFIILRFTSSSSSSSSDEQSINTQHGDHSTSNHDDHFAVMYHNSQTKQFGRYQPGLYIPVSSRWKFLPETIEHLLSIVQIPSGKITIVLNVEDEEAVDFCRLLSKKHGVNFLWKKPNGESHVTMQMTHAFYDMIRYAYEIQHDDFSIFLEDDLHTSPDFYQYFQAVARLMDQDETLICGSAWSDNAYLGTSIDEDTFMRGQHFMGLGWMMSAKMYYKLLKPLMDAHDFYANAFFEWEAVLRGIMIRNPDLECVFPEVSRTHHCVKDRTKVYSVSPYQQEYRFDLMRLAENHSSKRIFDLSLLEKTQYDKFMIEYIKRAIPVSSTDELLDYHDAELVIKCQQCDTSQGVGWNEMMDQTFGAYGFGAVERIVRGIYEECVFLRYATNRVLIMGSKSRFIHHFPNKSPAEYQISEKRVDIDKLEKSSFLVPTGKSCREHCEENGKTCSEQWLSHLNNCKRLETIFKSTCKTCELAGEEDKIHPSVNTKNSDCLISSARHLDCDKKSSGRSRFCICS